MTGDADHRITTEHRARLAMVYVRQSTEMQLRNHTESTRLQVGLREKAIALGWSQPVLIDDDLGVSAAGFADRPGFRELTTRITMKQVGIVLCLDASRLSRNSRDWAQLFELCGFFGTLIADLDQIYDLAIPNDRLVLGIKGMLSENELQMIKLRMRSGIEAKAARGELRTPLPPGFVHDPDRRIVLDPDQRVQAAIRELFAQFDRCTSVRQLALWYRDHRTVFPIRKRGPGEFIAWQIPTAKTLEKLLVHPIYAGAYVWGRRRTSVEFRDGRLIKRVKGPTTSLSDCRVCLQDHHPSYVPWARIVANVARITENRARLEQDDNMGAIREGLALLTGLLRCRRCGNRLYVSYKSKSKSAQYSCDAGHAKGSRRCMSFGATEIDRRVGEELCRALEPLALKASIAAFEQGEEEWKLRLDGLRLAVEAAQYEADRAFTQFDLVDPRNRLVADTLEARLNEKLADLKEARDRLENAVQHAPRLTTDQRRQLEDLAGNFPAVWNHPDADPRLKKALLRTVLREILVDVQPEDRRIEVTLHWQGGVHTRIHVKKYDRRRGNAADPDLIGLVRRLGADGIGDAETARVLNMHGTKTPTGLPWTEERARQFRRKHDIRIAEPPARMTTLTMSEAASYLAISRNGLLGLERMGAINRNQVVAFAPWRVDRKQLDSPRVRALVQTLKTQGRLPPGGCPQAQMSFIPDE
ncbi:MAG: recombinase family protein [Planctomycetes bacterium]|jgi:DNA invertase Pin-like site-specific DNA recombinase|nr:recombinase family protein [Planctomycetota bacterium]